MKDHISALKSQLWRLPLNISEFHDTNNLAITIATLEDCNKAEPLRSWVGNMKEYIYSLGQAFTLLTEESKRLQDESVIAYSRMEVILAI